MNSPTATATATTYTFAICTCSECGELLGYKLAEGAGAQPHARDHQPAAEPSGAFGALCYLCAHNFADVAASLHANHLPSHLDLYRAQQAAKLHFLKHNPGLITEQTQTVDSANQCLASWRRVSTEWRSAIIAACKRIRGY